MPTFMPKFLKFSPAKIFCLLLAFIPSLAHGSSNSNSAGMSPISSYYRPQELFDQSTVLADQQHRNYLTMNLGFKEDQLPILSPGCHDCFHSQNDVHIPIPSDNQLAVSQFEEAVEGEYWKNRRWLYTRAIAQESSSIFFLAAPLIIGYCVAMACDSSNAASMLLTTAFLATVYSTNTLRALIVAALFPANDPYVPYECAYAKKKMALNYLDWDQDREALKKGFFGGSAEEGFLTARLGMLNPRTSFDFLGTLLKVPTSSHPIQLNYTYLLKTLEVYGVDEVQKIALCCINHQKSYRKKLGLNVQQREFLTLISPPGQGKTYCVAQITRSMGSSLARIDLSRATPEGLLGTQTEPGLLLLAIIQLPFRNGVLFLDELCHTVKDERLLATLLTILDPTRKSFFSNYLQRTIDLSHLFIIVAGNEGFDDLALKSRFNALKTVNLTIQNRDKFFNVLMGKYLRTKLGSPISDEEKNNWRYQLDGYFGKDKLLSFRDGQNYIDCLVGNHRLKLLS